MTHAKHMLNEHLIYANKTKQQQQRFDGKKETENSKAEEKNRVQCVAWFLHVYLNENRINNNQTTKQNETKKIIKIEC